MRRLQTKAARAALDRAERAAQHAGIPAITAEVESASRILDTPAARLIADGQERPLLFDEIEALLASPSLVVDACRYVVRDGGSSVSLTRRPVLFALARALGEAWPVDVPREMLIVRAFRMKPVDESHRARLRVDPATGEVLESVQMSAGVGVSGLEFDGHDRFFCGGGNSGKVRAVRRPE